MTFLTPNIDIQNLRLIVFYVAVHFGANCFIFEKFPLPTP